MKTLTLELNSKVHEEAIYLLTHKATVRQAARYFGRSKTAIHNHMRNYLPSVNKPLAEEVSKLLEFNLSERAIRGGMATANKKKGKISHETLHWF